MKYTLILLLIFQLIFINKALSFDTRTHVWVSQQVINDLSRSGSQSNTVTIEPYGDFQVDPVLAHAIKTYPSVYRSGALGPDAFPDVVGGQVTTHPGIEGGWQTDDWLNHLLNQAENRIDYDNLERVRNGGVDATPRSYSYHSRAVSVYKDDILYRSASASDDYKELAFSYGYLSHAAADYFAHTYINWYAGDAFELSDEDSLDVELRHMVLEKYIATKQPQLLDASGNFIADPHNSVAINDDLPVDFIIDSVLQNQKAANEYSASGSAPHLVYMHEIIEAIKDSRKDLDDIKRNIVSEFIDQIVSQAAAAYIDVYKEPIIATADEAMKLCEITNKSVSTPSPRIGVPKLSINISIDNITGCATDVLGCATDAIDDTADNIKNISNDIADLLDASGGTLVNAAGEIVKLGEDTTNGLVSALTDILNNPCGNLGDALDKTKEEVEKVTDNLSDFAGDIISLKALIDAIDAILGNWQYDIEKANEEYIRVSSRVAKAVMDKPHGDPTIEIKEFLSCEAAAYIGAPSELTDAKCHVKNILDEVDNKISQLVNGIFPIKAQIDKIKQDIKDKIIHELGKVIIAELQLEDELELLKLAKEDGSEANLVSAFSLTGGSAKLISIPDIVNRVNSDLHLKSDGFFDETKFAPLHNAVVLSKLALLNAEQLNILASRAKVNHTAYNDLELFNNYGNSSRRFSDFNILYKGVRSIDGNFAWMPVAPHWPRQDGNKEASTDLERTFGYSNNGYDGFRLWLDPDAREKIFKKIFIGPIAPGIEHPASHGMKEIIPSNYKDRVCEANPFPLDTSYQRCGNLSGWLIPVLHNLK